MSVAETQKNLLAPKPTSFKSQMRKMKYLVLESIAKEG